MKQSTLSNKELALFCEQMNMTIKAGMTSYEGIQIIMQDNEPSLQNSLKQVEEQLDLGNSLHHSLKESKVFPNYMLDMIQIGEKAGRLEDVFNSLHIHYLQQEQIYQNIKSAFTYPMIMIALMLVIVIVLITKVLPIFALVFNQLGSSFSSFSQMLLNLGQLLTRYSTFFLVLLALFTLTLLYLTQTSKGKRNLNYLFIHCTLTKKLSLKVATSSFASATAIGLSSGLDIDESIELAKKIIDHPLLEKKVDACLKQMQDHTDFTDALLQQQIFTGMYSRLIQIGFKTGNYDQVMLDVANKYNEETYNQIEDTIAIIEPTLVALLSITVGIILLSILLPLMGIMSTLG